MTEETAKYHVEHFEQVTPTKKNILCMYSALRSKGDKVRLLRRIMTQEDLVSEMIEGDLGRQVFNAFKINVRAALRLDSPGHEKDRIGSLLREYLLGEDPGAALPAPRSVAG